MTVARHGGEKPLIFAHPQESCRVAADRMALHGIERLPILENGRRVGVLTSNDLLRARRKNASEETERERMISLFEKFSQVIFLDRVKSVRPKRSLD
jgi:CBS domain-containing protein